MRDDLHVCVVGPAEPSLLRTHLALSEPIPKGIGGVPVNDLVLELLDRGKYVTLVTHSPSVRDVWRRAGSRLAVAIVPSRARARDRSLDFFKVERRGIAEEVRRCQADIIHAHWTYEFALGAVDANVAPVLITVHDLPMTVLRIFGDPYRLIRWVMAWRVRLSSSHFTAVSPYAAEGWRREMLWRPSVSVVPNMLRPLPVSTATRGESPVILSVGDASPLKNLRTLIRSFAIVRRTVPLAKLRLVGEGLDSDGEMASWAQRERLGTNITFVGRVDRVHMADEYAKSTLYCHASLEETFGLVLIEALTAGLPVVAGKSSGAVPWTLFGGRAGRLVDVRSTTALAQALISTIEDPSGSVAPGFDVASQLQTRYSPESVTNGYLAAYAHLLGDAPLDRQSR